MVSLPDTPQACYIYTLEKNVLAAYEGYLIKYFEDRNFSALVEAYLRIKEGEVCDSISLKMDGLGPDTKYLSSFLRAGLIKCRRNQIAFFFYNHRRKSEDDVSKEMAAYEERASLARQLRIDKGLSLEEEFQELLAKHGHRFVFYLRSMQPHPCFQIGEARRIPDMCLQFYLGVLVKENIVHIPYQFGRGLSVVVELKSTSKDSVSKGVTGSVVDRGIAESRIALRNSFNWFVGEPTHTGILAAEEFEAAITSLSRFQEIKGLLDRTSGKDAPPGVHKILDLKEALEKYKK